MNPDVGVPGDFDAWPDSQVHVEWGVTGAALAARRGDVVVVVDVLSFSTSVAIAAERDMTCLVYSGPEITARGGPAAVAEQLAARALSSSRRVGPREISLSPQSLMRAERGRRVLFTSLNGASVVAAASSAPAVLIVGLRNASAGAEFVQRLMAEQSHDRTTIVASGEQWNSVESGIEAFRPAVEDWVGAGVICARLFDAGLRLSPEARLAAEASRSGVGALESCISARELQAAGFETDVTLALDVDASEMVAVRAEGVDSGREFRGMSPRG